MENAIGKYMKFIQPVSCLKDRGYIFQKLYARNYKTYRKDIGGSNYTIWLYVQSRTIEVNDWYGDTELIIKAFKNNPQAHKGKYSHNGKYCVLELNRATRAVRPRDHKKYHEGLMNGDLYENYMKGWREIIIYIPYFEDVLIF